MRGILFEYELNPTTWVYVSSLMMIGIYFKFRRFWSVRNLDLIGLIAYAPGLLALHPDLLEKFLPDFPGMEQFGYTWLFVVNGLFLIRLLVDPIMVRRPLLEPNLSAGGLAFTGVALLIFLMTNVVTTTVLTSDMDVPQHVQRYFFQKELPPEGSKVGTRGPGYPAFQLFATHSPKELEPDEETSPKEFGQALIRARATRTAAILAHLAVVIGIVLIGYRHFDNIHTGVAVASLYLLLPYMAQMTPRVDHVIPAALLVWAVEAYRRPVVAGVFVGLAAGLIFYPLFLLPLWCGFYWRRGLFRFLIAVLLVLLLMALSLLFTSGTFADFLAQLSRMFGLSSLSSAGVAGFWQYHEPVYRIPALAAFVVLCGSMALWPPQKNFGTLLSCSAAVMLATQFWHIPYGGVYLNWFLPLMLLTIFRPNLEDRVALRAVSEPWRPRRTSSG